ncbi:MAG TPA: formyltransferase [Myxococcota bacterium]|nr:formyltransferase [Myxococcota bacterium]
MSAAGPRVVVLAYSEVGHAALSTLLEMGTDVALVVTHADSPGETVWFQSVRERAAAAGVPVILPADANGDEAVASMRAARPDFLFSFYFRQMLSPRVLALAPRGALNLHGSLLPRYRGRSPVNWALLGGETETGVTLHYMDEKPDHGDIVGQRAVAIERADTALTLTRKLARAGSELLREVVPALFAGRAPRRPQDHTRSSYFGGRRPEDGEIEWAEPAERIRNLVRAVTDPWPGAFSRFRGEPLLIWWAECGPAPRTLGPGELALDPAGAPWVGTGEGALRLCRVSRPGAAPTTGEAWARAERVSTGERFQRILRATAGGTSA